MLTNRFMVQVRNGINWIVLEYKQDARQCWVCGGVVSDSALEKIRSLELTR